MQALRLGAGRRRIWTGRTGAMAARVTKAVRRRGWQAAARGTLGATTTCAASSGTAAPLHRPAPAPARARAKALPTARQDKAAATAGTDLTASKPWRSAAALCRCSPSQHPVPPVVWPSTSLAEVLRLLGITQRRLSRDSFALPDGGIMVARLLCKQQVEAASPVSPPHNNGQAQHLGQ